MYHADLFPKRFGHLDFWLIVTLACCIGRLWIMPLGSSFWVDEMGTYFVVHYGAHDPSLRVAPQVAASIYYVLPMLAGWIAGFSEAAYRFFSLLAMCGALVAIARLASRLFSPDLAWFAAFACLTSRAFNYQADDARPYALGTFVLALSLLLLVRWLDSARWRDGLLFAIAASALWWVHLMFWPFYLVFAAYALFRITKKDTAVGVSQLCAICALIAGAVLPVVVRAVALMKEASAHVIVAQPALRDLLNILKINAVILTGLGALLLNRLTTGRTALVSKVRTSALVLVLSWWLIDPVCVFAFSRLTGDSVFVARYLYLAIPGAVLVSVMLVAISIPPKARKPLALVLGLVVLISMGQWTHLWPMHHNSDWKKAAAVLQAWTGDESVPVICPSPFIEAQTPVWRPGYPLPGFIYANLTVYPVTGHIYPFPFVTSPTTEQYAAQLSRSVLSSWGRFAIYGGDRNVKFWQRWFEARPELKGWRSERLGPFGDVEIAVLWK